MLSANVCCFETIVYFYTQNVFLDSDSDEEDTQFYTVNESAERRASDPRPNHNLSLLTLTVVIGKGRLQAMTDKKVSQPTALHSVTGEYNGFDEDTIFSQKMCLFGFYLDFGLNLRIIY